VSGSHSGETEEDAIRPAALVAVTIIVGIGSAVLGGELLHSGAGAALGAVVGVGLLHLLVMLTE
jgi:hypothetical protein